MDRLADPERVGTAIATGVGGLETLIDGILLMERRDPSRLSPFLVPMLMANAASAQVSMQFGLKGPSLTHVSACASSPPAIGYGATADAYHITAPSPEGEGNARAMRMALAEAGLRPEQIDYINAHGTSTQPNDREETAAIKQVFGDHAARLMVSSTKSMTGHLLGAAGALEAIVCLLAIRDGCIPPTI